MTLAPPKAATEPSERSTNAARIGPAKLVWVPAARSCITTAPEKALGVGCEGVLERNVVYTPPFQNSSLSIQAGVIRCIQTAPCGPAVLGTSGPRPGLDASYVEGPGRLRAEAIRHTIVEAGIVTRQTLQLSVE